MKLRNHLWLATIMIAIGGCTDPQMEIVDQNCLGLENITDEAVRHEQYMQCRKACQEVEIYNMPEGARKNEIRKKCADANKIGSTQFKESEPRNWLGVMPGDE